MTIEIKPLSLENRKKYSHLVVGEAICPVCNQIDIAVVNDQGHRGYDYFENHYPKDGKNLCKGSEKMLAHFE